MKSWLDEYKGNEIILTFPNFRKFLSWMNIRHDYFAGYSVLTNMRERSKRKVRVKFWLYSKPEKRRFWRYKK